MRTIQSIAELRNALAPIRQQSKRIGFVPTMGALHEGHLSLVRLAKQNADVTVVSIFVNPTQFGPTEDFEKYPRTIEADVSMLVDAEVDFLFLPSATELYPQGHATTVQVANVTSMFEGAIRPGHFDGVATVVAGLFNVVQPAVAFFGQKDAQQVAVIKRMVRDLHFAVEIVVGETVRESGNLAMSSRNRYLNADERSGSESLSAALMASKDELLLSGRPERAKQAGIAEFERLSAGGKLDYLDIVDSETFQPITSFERANQSDHNAKTAAPSATIVIAARFGMTRLIDNITV